MFWGHLTIFDADAAFQPFYISLKKRLFNFTGMHSTKRDYCEMIDQTNYFLLSAISKIFLNYTWTSHDLLLMYIQYDCNQQQELEQFRGC